MSKPRKCRCGCGQLIPGGDTLRKAATAECAIKMIHAARAKEAVKREKEERKDLRERKMAIKTLATLCSEVQRDINKLIMEIYRDKPCISCGSPNISEAGHFFHAGSKYRTSRFRFDLRNIRPQCGHCNRHAGGGNQHGYRLGYIARHGIQAFEELEEAKRIADRGELLPLTKEEVITIGVDARKRLRAMQMDRL